MITKRLFDLLFVVPGILILSPLFLFCSIWIKLDSKGPVFFRQNRVGKHGKYFKIFKFRTMEIDSEKKGPKITVAGDSRITSSGQFLRKYKLDELPQLFNVFTGEMSLVGPRPEVPEYVSYYPKEIKDIILSVPPGITDLASITFRNENELLAGTSDPQQAYIENVLPIKLNYYVKYVRERSTWGDFKLIFRTLLAILNR